MLGGVIRSIVRGVRMVFRSVNAVHSVRSRVRVFLLGSVRRRFMEREFMALRYVVVYVGAIAVLFRFVVMRLNVREWGEAELQEKENAPLKEKMEGKTKGPRMTVRRSGRRAISVGRRVGPQERKRGGSYGSEWTRRGHEKLERSQRRDEEEVMKIRGQYRYTEGMRYVWLAGRVRRVARRGAVRLTNDNKEKAGKKRQVVSGQLSRDRRQAVTQ